MDVCSLDMDTEVVVGEALFLKWVLEGNEEDEDSKLMAASINAYGREKIKYEVRKMKMMTS